MHHYDWSTLPEERVSDMFSRRYIFGDKIMIARISLKKGCVVPTHSHEAEQMTTVFSGSMRFRIDGNEVVVQAGETLHIPSFVEHSAEALEDTDETDIFSPIRHDWIEGRDDYLRR